MKILFLGDIIGKGGRKAVSRYLPGLQQHFQPDFTIANGENSAGGFGLTRSVYSEMKFHHIDIITSGNHIWDKKEVMGMFQDFHDILRPANYPPGVPGSGCGIFTSEQNTQTIAVLNLIGRTFMGGSYDCPFRTADALLESLPSEIKTIFVDFHAEATSEKLAMLHYLAGRVSAIVGTHTHIQTADERIFKGTAYLTDAGMCGSFHSIIGMSEASIMPRFLQGMPTKLEVQTSDTALMGVFIETDEQGKAIHIERIASIEQRHQP
ncbi:TIGR00282 family metallophosphoesterase [Desulfurispirillum indicum]|uniref:TIGR00282 family metallophosphoesterase n=1 Tax=Desulfurispirillum indicum TaxID=936456 RepID=UPI001CFB9022|nr:TIGR00282 family metallophosphoesterase [Desulfurispirillum indicum]UCZ56165.1 TIGR00282 family metallophosphoesterase [Desulfurispirillum indicum]